jgi:hypothetical protein
VWCYQPQLSKSNRLKHFAIVASVLWLLSFLFLRSISGKMPARPWLRTEVVCVAAVFFVLPVFLSWSNFRWAQNTAYALTDQRVLMALGPRREDIRVVALKALGRVQIVNYRGRGKALLFNPRFPQHAFFGPKSIWTFPDTGETDTWATPYWRVHDPKSVQELLENARNEVWFHARGTRA